VNENQNMTEVARNVLLFSIRSRFLIVNYV